MPVFRATSSKNRWAIRSGQRWSELIGAPTASIGAEQSCRLGPISVVVSLLAAGVSVRHQGSNASPNLIGQNCNHNRISDFVDCVQ